MPGEATSRGLLDTNIVVHLPALDPTQLPDEMVISVITLAELSAGPHHASDPVERARRTNVLQHAEATFDPLPFDPLPFDTDAARAFGMVCAAVLTTGRTPRRRIADLMIAAVAIVGRTALRHQPRRFTGLDHFLTINAVQRPRTTAHP